MDAYGTIKQALSLEKALFEIYGFNELMCDDT